MNNSYVIDENNVVYKGETYTAFDNGGKCEECAFYIGNDVASCTDENGFMSFLQRNGFWCLYSSRKDSKTIQWKKVSTSYVAKEALDNRTEFDKMVCDSILG